jgi:hypothetical protein
VRHKKQFDFIKSQLMALAREYFPTITLICIRAEGEADPLLVDLAYMREVRFVFSEDSDLTINLYPRIAVSGDSDSDSDSDSEGDTDCVQVSPLCAKTETHPTLTHAATCYITAS